MAQQRVSAQKQQGLRFSSLMLQLRTNELCPELQVQYQSYKNILQQLASKIGDVEQEAEEHK